MKNRLFGMLLLVCSILIAFSSCKDDGDEAEATLKLDPVSVALLKGQPDSVKVKVTTNQKAWKATRPDADSWCTLVPGDNELWVKAEANPDTVYRETRLTFTAGSLTEYLTVKQLGTGKAQVLVNPQALELNAAGEAQPVVFVVSEGDKVVLPTEKVDGWCTVALDPENANGLLVSADVNKGVQERVAKVAIAAGFGKGMATDTIVVTQKGAVPAKTTFSPMEVVLTDAGTAVKVQVTTNQSDFSFTAPTGTDNYWCTVVRKGNELTISGTKNESESGRSVKIAFETGNTENLGRDTLVVIQQAKARSYQLWETYYYNGKPAGIVYQVSDDGMHGMILSIDELSVKEDDVLPANGQTTLYTEGPLGLDDKADGRVNHQKALAIDPTLENFPPFKWCANKNTGGESGWYIPSIEELDVLYFTLFEVHSLRGAGLLPYENPEWNPGTAKAFREKLASIEGSDPFVMSGEENEAASIGYYCYGSSTESTETITDPETDKSTTTYFFDMIPFNTDESPNWKPGYFSGCLLKNYYNEVNPELSEYWSGNELYYITYGEYMQRYRAVKRF